MGAEILYALAPVAACFLIGFVLAVVERRISAGRERAARRKLLEQVRKVPTSRQIRGGRS